MIKVLHFVSKMDRAGQETFIMNVFKNIDRSRIQFNFLCSLPDKGDYDDEIKSLGGHIYILPTSNENGKFSKYISEIAVIKNWLENNRDKYDVVHLHTYHALDVWVHLEACRRANVSKVIIHSHNTNAPHPQLHKLMRWICNRYSFTRFACSPEAGIWMYGKRAVDSGKVTVVYNGIDVSEFKYSEETARLYKEELGVAGRTVLGHIGRFNYQKNHEFLLEVFDEYLKKDPGAVLLLIGKGELEDVIKEKAESLKITESVRFLGTRDDIPNLLNAMDCFVFPSHFEGLSVVLVEAQCNGLSIVANNNTASEAIISDGLYLLPLESKQEWAEKILQIAGKRTDNIVADKFDIKKTVRLLTEKYFSIVG